MRKTKIVATLGPSNGSLEMIKDLINAGMSVARFNFSHGTHESHTGLINTLIQAREELDAPVPMMLDTKGPEVRIGQFADGAVKIEQGQRFTFTTKEVVGDNTKVSVTYTKLPNDVKSGDRLLLDDGLIEFKILKTTSTDIECEALNSGTLGSRKGVNVPDVYLNMPFLTEKDKADIIYGIKMGFDYIAASFTRCAKDVLEIRQVLEDNGGDGIHIIAKIESRDGVNNVDAILDVADGIMVARGDLGVEIPPEEVPMVQKSLIRKANMASRPVITATHMLESMINNPRPTRAEANDVANAIYDGTDAIMLSGETAMGKYPVEAVKMMARIAVLTENAMDYKGLVMVHREYNKVSTTNAICYSSCATAADLDAAAIVTVTSSGFTARMIAKFKPPCPVVAVALSKRVWRQLSLVWGCYSTYYDKHVGDADVFKVACAQAEEAGFAKNGETIVITAGLPVGVAGSTNFIKVQVVGDILARGKVKNDEAEFVVGRSAVIKRSGDAENLVRTGDILIASSLDEKMMTSIRRAKAVIIGSEKLVDTTYAETVCHALQTTLVICNIDVLNIIPDDISITIDCVNGLVYNGEIDRNQ
jgi:pyruvate kinase